jgi:hypothetical protein
MSRTNVEDQRAADRRRDEAAQRLADYIEVTVRMAPPLTQEQRDRLALLLRGDVA